MPMLELESIWPINGARPAAPDFFSRLVSFLNANLANQNLRAEFVASMMGVSKSTLNRRLKQCGEPSINKFINEMRLNESKKQLRNGVCVLEVSKMVGFSSHSYFTYCFKKQFGTTPGEFATRYYSVT